MTKRQAKQAMRHIPWGKVIPAPVLGLIVGVVYRQAARAEMTPGERAARRLELRRELGK